MSSYGRLATQPPPNLTLQLDGIANGTSAHDDNTNNGNDHDHNYNTATTIIDDVAHGDNSPGSALSTNTNKPKSPGQKFTSFFGWNSSSKSHGGTESPTTTFSEQSPSPGASPINSSSRSPAPAALDIPKANAMGPSSYFTVPGTPLLSTSPAINAHVEELERELREVSAELAGSIRREMELEDEIERWRADNTMPPASAAGTDVGGRRTSDYYSDSGASSVRLPLGGGGMDGGSDKLEELEKLRRKAEQEKAQLKVEMAQKVQEELRRRRDLEAQVDELEKRLETTAAAVAEGAGSSSDGTARAAGGPKPEQMQELEAQLDDAHRRLAEERTMKDNFEALITALQDELEQHRQERDNLRDEVVPQLRARVEGLESDSSDLRSLTYENTRMQQELQNLRNENATLVGARRMQMELQQQQARFNSIAEEPESPSKAGVAAAAGGMASPRVGLTRSNSLARGSIIGGINAGTASKRGSLSRSSSVKEPRPSGNESPREGGGNVSERVRDLESQRDALHHALRSLLRRQECQARHYEKRLKVVEAERDRALNATPRRTAFSKEVRHLRDEVNHLRRRADDALEQKWHCEKGLSGLKMDLDRAKQETGSLRVLLHEHDIVPPDHEDSKLVADSQAALALDRAYSELQTTHALSLARLKDIEDGGGVAGAALTADAERTVELLKQSISDAETERLAAQREAAEYRHQARALQQSEAAHLSKEQHLASELLAAARRMDALAAQCEAQLSANRELRARLADAIGRGEREQRASADRIVRLQAELRALEDRVLAAQSHSEDVVAKHEDEVRRLKESHVVTLQRLGAGAGSSSMFALRSPRLDRRAHGGANGQGVAGAGAGTGTMAEFSRTEFLERRVGELEKALAGADREMEEVVGRMNMAQIEVAELQAER
ncbi:hypothetical protein BDY21DRAFT_279675 [Lineolata rhizophorae]|uniref:DUF7603 domain-containing protein n=1 Tax=Lineolata rhizophorae TaxID=578093 RepID=A0A6A6PCH9_9PEZI|nr:hypothetical protein BDY21DRAFT_279675 [Lineolata rhizophorae]